MSSLHLCDFFKLRSSLSSEHARPGFRARCGAAWSAGNERCGGEAPTPWYVTSVLKAPAAERLVMTDGAGPRPFNSARYSHLSSLELHCAAG